MAALAVIFLYPAAPFLQLVPLPAQAASAITVANGEINGNFPGSQIPASSPSIAILKLSVTASQAAQTLTSVTVDFSGTGFTTSDLQAIATDATSGVALYDDSGSVPGSLDGGDSVVTLAGTPDWTPATTNITLTPATPPVLSNGSAAIFYVAIKTSGTPSNNDEIRATVPAAGVVTSDGNGPASDFAMNYVKVDTTPPAISEVSGYVGQSTLTVRFNKPVRKASGGALQLADTPFTFTDNGITVGTTITAIAHNEGQDFATITLSNNLDSGDLDGTPSTIAAGSNKIADFGGTAVGTAAVSVTSPLTITTPNIPTAIVGTTYDTTTPLVAFATQGGTAPYTFAANAATDTSTLTTVGLSIVNDTGTYKITGTVNNVPGSYQLGVSVSDNGAVHTSVRNYTLNVGTSAGGVPGITQLTPPGVAQGATLTGVSVVGGNTHFSGSSTVALLLNGSADADLAISSVSATDTTHLTFTVVAAGGAALGSRDVRITTGSEVVNMPSGFSVFATGAAGLSLSLPTSGATNVPLPPSFSFSPSSDNTVLSYRIDVNTTSNFGGTTLWDYVFPKPSDVNNSNGSHCTDSSCNLVYGSGIFNILTAPTFLNPNTTYYWRVRTYAADFGTVSNASTAVEVSEVRGFTTVFSVTDVTPPSIQHRPLFQATESADLVLHARVFDNIATSSTSPALSTSVLYCSTNACSPTTEVAGVSLGSGYYSYTIPSAGVPAAGGVVRYYLAASDGTNTQQFKDAADAPFQVATVAAGAATVTGFVKDSSSTCSAGIQTATVYADGTGYSATTNGSCAFTLSGMPTGTYDIVAVKDGYADRTINGIPTGTSGLTFALPQGGAGGFGGDTTKPRVKFTGPMDGMTNMPGGDSNFKIFAVFDKAISQSTVNTSGNLTVNEIDPATGNLNDVTTSKGAWTYYPTAPFVAGLPPEANMAVWSLSGVNTLGDGKTIAVLLWSNITDTAGNALQGNQSDGSYAFSFTTGSSADFTNFDSNTGTFQGGGTFGSGAFVPPFVTGITPAPGSFSVPRNVKAVVNFSEPMADDAGAYLLKSYIKLFTVSGATETDISSSAIDTVALDSGKQNAIVTLKSSYNSGTFSASTNYRLKVLGGAKAATGITLAQPGQEANVQFTADFTTGTGSDTGTPTILGSFPDTGATNVPVNIGAINVGFSKDMSATTLTTSTFYLSVGSTAVNGTVDYDPIGRQAFFIPKTALNTNTTYTINLTASIQGLNSQAISATTRTFTTGAADTTAPTVNFVNADDYNLAVTFTEPMNAAKATDTLNYAGSILKPANVTLKYGTAGFDSAAGTVITIPSSASFSYDTKSNTLNIQGYQSGIDGSVLHGKELLVTVANVKDLSGNAIATANGVNTGRAPIGNSATTKGALGPGAFSGDAFSQDGAFVPTNFSGDTFGFAPPVDARPFNTMAGQTTIFGIRLPVSKQINASGSIVLTFPTGFDVSGAMQDVNSPMRQDLNGPGSGTVTFKCASAGAPTGASCSGTANSDDTGSAAGGLTGDGVVVNTSSRTATIYLSAATNVEGHDFLTLDIAGVKNSTVPKDFNTSGYTVDIKTKNATGTLLESLTSQPFFVQSAGASTLSGTITATGNDQSGTMQVYLMSPMTGQMSTTSADFSGGTTATYSFTNLPDGEYSLFTDQEVTIGIKSFSGKSIPERVVVSGATTYNFSMANNATGGTNVTVSVDGPANEPLDIFAGSDSSYKVKQITLNGTAGAESFTLNLPDGHWFVGVGPQHPKGVNAGPPPTPSYLPPKPIDVTVAGATVTETSGTANDGTISFTLTNSTKTIQGLVQDASGKVMANAEVYAYSPQGGRGTNTQADSAGAFTLNVVDGSYIVGAFILGMPPSREVPVSVTTDATTYLIIGGSTTAITPAAAASSFVIKVAKPDYTISGKVTDGTNTVQGASVYAYRTNGPGHADATTDSSGNYTLYVASGTWQVGAFLPQYGNLSEATVTVTTASVSNQNFTPSTTGTFRSVSGTVTKGGSAVQGAFVRLKGNGTFNEAITAADGTYSFKVPEGSGYVISAFLPGVGETPPLAAFSVSGSDVSGKDIALGATNTITVTFSSSVANASVEMVSSTGVGNRVPVSNASTATLQLPNGSYNVRVNIPGVPIGPTDIAATSGATVYSNTTGSVTVDGNEGLTVTLPTLRTVSGTVKDASANAIAEAWVEIGNPTTGVHFGTKSAADGTFSLLVGNAATDYFLNAMNPGYFRDASSLTVNASVADGDLTGIVLTLASASTTISGQVSVGVTGAANAFIRAEKQGGGFSGTQADANGNYSLPVSSGVWRVYAVAEGYAETGLTDNPIDVTAGSVSGKNITLSTTVSLRAPKSKPITPSSGGTLEDTTQGVRLTIPANALGSSTAAGNIQVKETNNVRSTSTALPLGNKAKEIKATNSSGNPITNLNDNVTVEMTYTKAELAATRSAADSAINTKAETDQLKMAYWDETTANWVPQSTTITYKNAAGDVITDDTTIDTAAEFDATVASVTVSAGTNHFSLYAPVVSTDPSAPSTPTGFDGTASSSTQIALSWTQVSGATSYDIYRSTSSGGTFSRLGSEPTVSSGSTVTYSDTGLSASTAYYYKITSLNASGESAASSELSVATSATPAASSGGGGGGLGFLPSIVVPTPTSADNSETPTEEPTTDSSTTPTTTEPNEREQQIEQILTDAGVLAGGDAAVIAETVGAQKDSELEAHFKKTVVQKIASSDENVEVVNRLVSFVTYGTPSTLMLGAGERGGVVNSFHAAFGHLPTSETDWQDVLKIAGGRWPTSRSETREAVAAKNFVAIYHHQPNMEDSHENAAVTVLAYGLRPTTRNLDSERVAITTYRKIFGHVPVTATAWDAVRAIAYSGATR